MSLLKTGAILDSLQAIFQSKVEEWKIGFYKKIADILASIILLIIVSFVFLMMLLFLGLGLSFYLNNALGSCYLGFVLVALLFLFSAWIMSLSIRTGYLQRKLLKMMIRILEKSPDERLN
jgi:hypothetical protein